MAIKDEHSDRPPVMKSWPGLYALVLAELALLIALFYAFSLVYR